MGRRRSDYLLTVPTVWIERSSPTPSTHVITSFEPPVNDLLSLFSDKERDESHAVTIINKLSGKALEVEGLSNNQGARFSWLHELVRLVNDGLLSAQSLLVTGAYYG
jgi:hypothetical protein